MVKMCQTVRSTTSHIHTHPCPKQLGRKTTGRCRRLVFPNGTPGTDKNNPGSIKPVATMSSINRLINTLVPWIPHQTWEGSGMTSPPTAEQWKWSKWAWWKTCMEIHRNSDILEIQGDEGKLPYQVQPPPPLGRTSKRNHITQKTQEPQKRPKTTKIKILQPTSGWDGHL